MSLWNFMDHHGWRDICLAELQADVLARVLALGLTQLLVAPVHDGTLVRTQLQAFVIDGHGDGAGRGAHAV